MLFLVRLRVTNKPKNAYSFILDTLALLRAFVMVCCGGGGGGGGVLLLFLSNRRFFFVVERRYSSSIAVEGR